MAEHKNPAVPAPRETAHLQWDGHPIALEYQWVGVEKSAFPVVIFLHEGLGSIALWKDFPERFCRENNLRGLVYSRYGYGNSLARPPEDRFGHDFMHREAWEVLPQLLAQLGIRKPWLFGHSDGGTIALLHAARFPSELSGVIVAAPHISVEDECIAGIAAAGEMYRREGLRKHLARYHADVDPVFWRWNEVWLDPSFRSWNIEDELAAIECPLMAIQGEDDEYGTLEQIYGIKRRVPHTRIVVLPQCGHSPHRDQAEAVIKEAGSFITHPVQNR